MEMLHLYIKREENHSELNKCRCDAWGNDEEGEEEEEKKKKK